MYLLKIYTFNKNKYIKVLQINLFNVIMSVNINTDVLLSMQPDL